MKKLILTVTVALLTSGVSVFAANNINTNNADEIVVVVTNDDFKEITAKELPEAVSNAIVKDYTEATITKVYVNTSEQYKIILTANGTENVVYADKEGNWLKETAVIAVKEGENVSEEE
ncbi:hypothetical protein MPF19_16320 [Polaribacter sp. Z014]|uniref:hypothetical protein n=1 Tax=Polaribacter sp. Z014 TaxID=2927126 RepID=UPI00201FBCDC|nr:hypothetical protein [Polaribacter sp. Z014]MCL7764989.1 hypothetical protein [Polaribacter sp. Z014]